MGVVMVRGVKVRVIVGVPVRVSVEMRLRTRTKIREREHASKREEIYDMRERSRNCESSESKGI